MTITLPDDLASRLAVKAARQGVPVEQMIVEGLSSLADESHLPQSVAGETGPKNFYEKHQHLFGRLDSRDGQPGGINLSKNTGKHFTELLLERRQKSG